METCGVIRSYHEEDCDNDYDYCDCDDDYCDCVNDYCDYDDEYCYCNETNGIKLKVEYFQNAGKIEG